MIEQLLPLVGSGSGGNDPYLNYVTMLLRGDGSNNGQNATFLDSSINNLTVTRTGDVAQGTFSPFSKEAGKWGGLFSTSANITWGSNITVNGSTDFCCEAWVFLVGNAGQAYGIIFAGSNIFGAGTDTGNLQFQINNDGAMGMVMEGFVAATSAAAGTFKFNQWNHVVWCRTGTTCSIFYNGTRVGTGTSSYQGTFRYVNGYSSYQCNGYISNARIVTGSNPYNAASTTITVPISPLTAITNTKLLTCQDNRIKDNSASPYTLTITSVIVTPFSPFGNSYDYSTTLNGGSHYFDGSGDYFSVPYTTANFDWFTSGTDYTIECWVYPTTFTGWSYLDGGLAMQTLVGNRSPTSFTNYWSFGPNASGVLGWYYYTGTPRMTTSSFTLRLNEWSHIAMTKTSNGFAFHHNGSSSANTTIIGTPLSGTEVNLVVGQGNNTGIKGYVSNLRIVRGTALYSGGSSYTVPSSPLTAVTNTKVLFNAINSNVIDAAKKATILTVADARSNTSQKKFGSGSIWFDGTGDYLNIINDPSSALNEFGSGNFTIECWIYFNSTSGFIPIVANGLGVAGGTPTYESNWSLYLNASNLTLTKYVAGVQTDYNFAWTPSTAQWYHVAVSRSGTSLRAFIDGTQIGTTQTSSLSFSGATNNPGFSVGRLLTGLNGSVSNFLNGNIDELRLTKGHARYTANFTAPAGPFLGV